MVSDWFGLVRPLVHCIESLHFPMDLLGLGLVRGWFGLVSQRARLMESLLFPMNLLGLGLVWPRVGLIEPLFFPIALLGLGLVWLGLAAGAFVRTIAFFQWICSVCAWFGLVWGWFGLVSPRARLLESIAFSNGSAWFGFGNRRSHESDDNSTVRRTCPQSMDHHRFIAYGSC